jgi:primosomal protein N' (replication factor Y)
MDRCPGCAGRRLSPFGWSPERVEHAVRRRFQGARIARYDPEARGERRSASQAVASAADVVIGTRGALKLFGPGALGLVGFVSPDQWLRLPDFRASERLFQLAWAAAERIKPGGTLIVQSQHPSHHAFASLAAQDLTVFYDRELAFRAELGYPPFRRLAVLTVRPKRGAPARLVNEVEAALRGARGLVVYPATPARRESAHRIVVKGDATLPTELSGVLGPFGAARWISRGIIDVEVDPVEWF